MGIRSKIIKATGLIRDRNTKAFMVIDQVEWAFYWVGKSLTMHASESWDFKSKVVRNMDAIDLVKDRVIHFIDRYRYLSGVSERLIKNNRVVLNWFHGELDNPEHAPMFEQLLKGLDGLDKIITPNKLTTSELIRAGVKESLIQEIPIGINVSDFGPADFEERQKARESLGIPQEAFCIGSFQKDGNGWEEGLEPKLIKGPDIFLETLSVLATRQKNLLVLLTGPSRGYVKQGLEKLGIPYVHDYLEDYKKINLYYNCLDAYFISSRCEGGPKTMAESWASGVPLVSTNMGMPADYVRHNENGLLAPSEDVQSLADNLERIKEDEGLRRSLTETGKNDVRALDWKVLAGRYIKDVYQ